MPDKLPPEHLFSQALDEIPSLPFPHLHSGKVREIFDLEDHLLLVATDRISAYDHALRPAIPGKGIFLTQLSRFWFEQLQGIVASQLDEEGEARLRALGLPEEVYWRSLLVKKCRPLPVECVVRGYLAGSGWEAYQANGEILGQALPAGLRESERLPEPLFTPTTKEKEDRPLTLPEAREILGEETFNEVRAVSFRIYAAGEALARKAGLILADTKFEFGFDAEGRLLVIDEVLTPDSSRFWPADGYELGRSQPSFDKQYVRDFLRQSGWKKGQPVPVLPPEVVQGTHQRYRTAWERLRDAGG